MQRTLRWTDYAEVSVLFFLQTMSMGAWFVPLGPLLDAHGLHSIKSYAFATSATAAFVSPLLFGAVADRHLGPARVLRWLASSAAAATLMVTWAIHSHAGPWIVLALIQLLTLCAAPTWALTASIALSRLTDPRRQFGPVRSFGTLGWMTGCWIISALNADSTLVAPISSALMWMVVASYSWTLPSNRPPGPRGHSTIRQRLGLDALVFLRDPKHRVIFLTAALLEIPLAAFYPHAPTHLLDLGLKHTSAWMTLGQITEVLAMLGLASVLARISFRVTFAAGLAFGLIRYALCALDGRGWVLLGVTLHGMAYTLYFITAQIYLDQCVDAAWRARAQALLSVMITGVGNLIGYLATGQWFEYAHRSGTTNWPLFWGGLAIAVACVLAYFLIAFPPARSRSDVTM